jgi:hypothetical protein
MSEHVLAKWSDDVLDEGFTAFPKRLIRAAPRVFSGSEGVSLLCAVMAIADFRRPGAEWSAPSLEFLAFTAGVSPGEFKGRLQRLEELGLLTVSQAPNTDPPRILIDLKPLFERVKKESRDDV